MAMLVTAAVTVKISLLAMLARIPSRFHCPCPALQGACCPDCGVFSGLGGGGIEVCILLRFLFFCTTEV